MEEPISGFCSNYITLTLTIIGYSLLALSEVLGLRNNKEYKCTSLSQGVCAVFLWLYYKVTRRPRPRTIVPEKEDDVESIISRNLTIGSRKRVARREIRTDPPIYHLQRTELNV